MADTLNVTVVEQALRHLGEHLRLGRDVEILIVGGAAGMLTREFPATWTTGDVDAIHYKLAEDREAVLRAGEEVGRELRLPASWLSDWGGLYDWTLPDGWERRRVHVGTFGHLRVYAVSRIDLISMKFIANRARDLEHLDLMVVTAEEKILVGRYLDALAGRYPVGRYPDRAGKVEKARLYLAEWGDDHGS